MVLYSTCSAKVLESWCVVEKMKAAGRSLMIGRCQFDLQSQILAYILYPAAISRPDRADSQLSLSWENVNMRANIYSLSPVEDY